MLCLLVFIYHYTQEILFHSLLYNGQATMTNDVKLAGFRCIF